MTSIEFAGTITNTPFDISAKSLLQLYSGPIVVIRIGSDNYEYRFPKALLCTQVPYFSASFKEEHFKEGKEQSTTLEEIDGVVSPRSFEMLVPWVCIQRVVIKDLPPVEAITLLIEFARLVDYLQVTGIDSLIAEHIKRIILSNKEAPEGDDWALPRNEHTTLLTFEHIISGVQLPHRHPVRKMLASAVVKGWLLRDSHTLFTQIQELPDFAADLLVEMRVALESLQTEKRGTSFIDPFDGQRTRL